MEVVPPKVGSERWIKERRWRRFTLLQRCLLFSLLIHILLLFLFGLVVVSRQIVRSVSPAREMTVELMIEMPEAMEVVERLRSVASELQIEDPTLKAAYQSQKASSQSPASRAQATVTAGTQTTRQQASNLESPAVEPSRASSSSSMRFDPAQLSQTQPSLSARTEQPLPRESEQPTPSQSESASRRLETSTSVSQAVRTSMDVPASEAPTGSVSGLNAPAQQNRLESAATDSAIRPRTDRALQDVRLAASSTGQRPLVSEQAEPIPGGSAAPAEMLAASSRQSSEQSHKPASYAVDTTSHSESDGDNGERSMVSAAAVGANREFTAESASRSSSMQRFTGGAPGVGTLARTATRVNASEESVDSQGSGVPTATRASGQSSGSGGGAAAAAEAARSLQVAARSSDGAGTASSMARSTEVSAASTFATEGVRIGKGTGRLSGESATVAAVPGSAAGRGRVSAAESSLESGDSGTEGSSPGRLAGESRAQSSGAASGVTVGVAPSSSTGHVSGIKGDAGVRGSDASGIVAQGVGRDRTGVGTEGFAPTVSVSAGGGAIATGEADVGSNYSNTGENAGASQRMQAGAGQGDAASRRPGGVTAGTAGVSGSTTAVRSLVTSTAGVAVPASLDGVGDTAPRTGRLVPIGTINAGGAPVIASRPANVSVLPSGSDDSSGAMRRPSVIPAYDVDEPSLALRKMESGSATAKAATIESSLPQSGVTDIRPISAAMPSVDIRDTTPAPAATNKLFDRSPAMRRRLVETMGGSKESEDAVARALAFLARTQEADGRWTHFLNDRSTTPNANYRHNQALTGLATLCFLAADHTPDKDGPYRDTVTRSLQYLLRHLTPEGDLRADGNMYSHAIATLALAEAAIMTGDEVFKEAALRGARFICTAQNPRDGSWRYKPLDAGDTSVLGWQVLALHSAEFLGFELPPETRTGAFRWLDKVSSGKHGVIAGYQSPKPRATMTAQAALSRMLLGQELSVPQQEEVCEYLLRRDPLKDSAAYYLWYYCSLSMMQMQNDAWRKWNPYIRDYLVASQVSGGERDGSWTPDSNYGFIGGRIYSTALATLTLEVYYRYLPMYQRVTVVEDKP